MSGVIDEDGTQWEHCNACGEFVRIDDLAYGTVTQEMADEMFARSVAWYEESPAGRHDIRTRPPEWFTNRDEKLDLCPPCADRAGGHPIVGPALTLHFHADGSTTAVRH